MRSVLKLEIQTLRSVCSPASVPLASVAAPDTGADGEEESKDEATADRVSQGQTHLLRRRDERGSNWLGSASGHAMLRCGIRAPVEAWQTPYLRRRNPLVAEGFVGAEQKASRRTDAAAHDRAVLHLLQALAPFRFHVEGRGGRSRALFQRHPRSGETVRAGPTCGALVPAPRCRSAQTPRQGAPRAHRPERRRRSGV
jgi:hypothetical protein